jgi:hypothetical protein
MWRVLARRSSSRLAGMRRRSRGWPASGGAGRAQARTLGKVSARQRRPAWAATRCRPDGRRAARAGGTRRCVRWRRRGPSGRAAAGPGGRRRWRPGSGRGRGQGRGFQQRAPVAVGAEVTGAGCGTVAGDDAEVLGADGLDAGHALSVGLLQDKRLAWLSRASVSRTRQGKLLSRSGLVNPQPERQSGEAKRVFLFSQPPYHGRSCRP